MTLKSLGWNSHLIANFPNSTENLARVTGASRDALELLTVDGKNLRAKLLGKWRSKKDLERPGIGDWVEIDQMGHGEQSNEATIKTLIPRFSYLARVASGFETRPQLIASNIDYALLVSSPNDDFSMRRIERFLAICKEGNVTPIVVITKSDLIDNESPWRETLKPLGTHIASYFVSMHRPESIRELQSLLGEGKTAVLLGSSGVGKSTLINSLMGNLIQKTQSIREKDSKGRHTTTERSLHFLPTGGMIIDTPGIRELKVAVDPQSLLESFSDIETLTHQCKFTNCQHLTEPGCKVKEALSNGDLTQERYDSYQKLVGEITAREKKKRGY